MTNTQLALLIDRFMRRMHSALNAKAKVFDIERIGPLGGMVLMTLAELGPVSMIELTQQVARDKSQMTRIIRALETKGLVERQTPENDARVFIVSLTRRGHDVVEKLHAVVAETINEILSPMSEDDKDTLTALFRRALD